MADSSKGLGWKRRYTRLPNEMWAWIDAAAEKDDRHWNDMLRILLKRIKGHG